MIWKLLWNKYLFIHFNLLFAKWQTFSPGLLWTVQNVAFISNFVPNEKKFWEPRTRNATKHIEAKIRWRIFFRRHFCTYFLEWKYLNFDLKFHWSLFLSIQFTISKHRFRQWLGADQATSHYLNQWRFILLMHICITRPQWINSLWPSETIWWHKSGSTLAQVMAWCLTAPSHYLNQCWLIISKVQWHSSWVQLYQKYLSHQSLKLAWKLLIKFLFSNVPGPNELTPAA